MKIALVYLSNNLYGGWVTFTRHLYDALTLAGNEVILHKVGNTCSSTTKNYGYGLSYILDDLETLRLTTKGQPVLITGVQKNYAPVLRTMLTWPNTFIVLHDPSEIGHVPEILNFKDRIIVIRDKNKKYADKATFIRHPYVRSSILNEKTALAMSVSRIDFDKNTSIILDANRLLPENKKVIIRGFENRIYTRFNIVPNYPEWIQSVNAFPREKEFAVTLLSSVCYLVDMSTIQGDGGGSQYTFLEAIDAGAELILNEQWFAECEENNIEIVPGKHCHTVAPTGKDLAAKLEELSFSYDDEMTNKAKQDILPLHDPIKIAHEYTDFFNNRML
jgi:hypothetical protein